MLQKLIRNPTGLMRWVAYALVILPSTGWAEARVATVKRVYAPLDDFRRVELLVPEKFKAKCTTSRNKIRCRMTHLPERFTDLMIGLRGGNIATVELESGRRGQKNVVFNLRRKELRLQQTVLTNPNRWVVEIGVPSILIGPVREQFPFRPYPVPASNVSVEPPPVRIMPPDANNPENQGLLVCFNLWEKNKSQQALETCGEVIKLSPKSAQARVAERIIAEIWTGLVEPENNEQMPQVIGALKTAELACTSQEQSARYVLLASKVYEAMGYINRAELHLANRIDRYRDPAAASYLLAARARLLIRLNESESARKLLEALRRIKSDAPTVGTALGALAELAYHEKKYVVSVGLFDMVKARWPKLLNANSSAMFELGELYMLYGRTQDAVESYKKFLALPIKAIPEWMAQIRLIEILSYTKPNEAAAEFRKLIQSLKKTEGQDLAFLRLARLTPKARDRRRIIRNLGAAPTTDYVMEELTVQSIQQALDDGNLFDAYRYAVSFWRNRPKAGMLTAAPTVFDRVLSLFARQKIKENKPMELLRSYYADRKRYEGHQLRGRIHLDVAQTFRDLAMFEEAVTTIQAGLGGRTPEREPNTTAKLYREMAAVLWRMGDRYRLGEIMDYLDDRYPKQFDDFDYWMARAHRVLWDADSGEQKLEAAQKRYERLLKAAKKDGTNQSQLKRARDTDLANIKRDTAKRYEEARKILVFALNGPMSGQQRLDTMRRLADLYINRDMGPKAIKVLQAYLELYDKLKKPRQGQDRRDIRWRIAELAFAYALWGKALAALTTFLAEYPDDPSRYEARFLSARSLLELGDTDGAKRQFNLVSKKDAKGFYGQLALRELELIKWRAEQLSETLKRANL